MPFEFQVGSETCNATKEAPVSGVINELEAQFKKLKGSLENLEKRLAPILGIEPPTVGMEKEEDPTYGNSPLVNRLSAFGKDLFRLTTKVGSLARRCEI